MESPQQDPRIGVVLNGRYRITELLGEGGMGLVYRGERLQLGRPVAIKFLHSPYAKSPKYMARFEREARAMSKLSHPYCVSVIDFGLHDEPYIVMDFVTGETLRDLMDRGRPSAQRAVYIIRQVLAGLSHAHAQGVIHRDIKPGNVMVGEAAGVGDHVRIFDFGLAKLHDPAVEPDQSMATVIGTPAYMAPEQTRAEAIDARADLYAVGVMLFEMLTGEKPFIGDDAYAIIRMQRDEPPPLLRSRSPALSPELEVVVARALEKDRLNRYQTAAEFAAALELTPEGRLRPSGGPENDGPPTGSRAALPAAVPVEGRPHAKRYAVLGLALVGAVGAFVYLGTRPEPRVTSAVSTRPPRAAPKQVPAPSALTEPEAAPAPGDPAPVEEAARFEIVEPSLDASLAALEVQVEEAVIAADGGEVEEVEAPLEAVEGDDLSTAELRAADQALDATEELEARPVAVNPPDVKSLSDVHMLIDAGHLDAAILGLRRLRKQSPQNPYLPYLLGDVYFDRGWWSDALAKYREAIRLSPGYRKRSMIHKNAIQALGSKPTYARARALIVRDLGAFALRALDQAVTKNPSPVIQKRARAIAQQIRRTRR